MAYPKGIVWTFKDIIEAADPSKGAEGVKFFQSVGQDLERIALMPHIPYNSVFQRITETEHGDG